MKYPLAILFLILSLAVTIRPQQTNESSLNNPLDCAILLLSKDRLESTYGNSLTRALFRSGRYEDAIKTARSDKDLMYRFLELSEMGLSRLAAGDRASAVKFATAAFDDFSTEYGSGSVSLLFPLIDLMIGTGNATTALMIAEQQEYPDDKAKAMVEIAAAYLKFGDKEASRAALESAMSVYDSSDCDDLLIRSDLYAKLGNSDRSLELLSRAESNIGLLDDPIDRDSIRRQLFSRFMGLGDEKRAIQHWERIADNDDVFDRLKYSAGMIRGSRFAPAERVLAGVTQKELEQYMAGREVVKQYLQLGKTTFAERSAKAISTSNDDYDQQNAFMQIADHYIKLKKNDAASAILDLAFRRASKIVFEHLPEQSNGASSGTRKWKYLSEISTRYVQLGKIEQAYASIAAIDGDHQMAKEYFAAGTARFALENAKRLSPERINRIFAASLKMIGESDSEYYQVEIIVDQAEAAAIIGKPDKAAEILADMFAKRTDSSPDGYALILAGEIFEKYHLRSNESLRKSLSEIIESYVD